MPPKDAKNRRELQKTLGLMRRSVRPTKPDLTSGYLDLCPDAPEEKGAQTPAQRLMVSRFLPLIYERWWRPVWSKIGHGLLGPSMRDEYQTALHLLELEPGDVVLDVACGPGNFTRRFAAAVGQSGLAIGSDISHSMLERAASEHPPQNTVFLRTDALDLPLRDATVDAACCFAALNLFEHPTEAIEEIHRVLKPGGRIALLTTSRTSIAILSPFESAISAISGMTMFSRGEIVTTLEMLNFKDVSQQIFGAIQIVGGTKA